MRRAAILVVALSWAVPSLWAEVVVYPTGSFPADPVAVQAAVDTGERVLLKSVDPAGRPTAFDFGPTDQLTGGTVFLTRDVEIRGERAGRRPTTIRGGFFPFRQYEPARVAIRRIRFEGPGGGGAFLGASTGAEITDNVVTHVAGFPWIPGERKGTGFWIGGGCCLVTGTITIARNTISDIDAEDGIGLALVAFDADIRVIANDIRGMNFAGILAFGHTGRLTIEENVVEPGPPRFPGSVFTAGNGIEVGPPSIADTGAAVIRGNRVLCENPSADGILLLGFDHRLERSVVSANRVEMKGSLYGGITLLDNVSRTLVELNRVTGDGAYALNAFAVNPDVPLQGNLFLANSTSAFEASVADVFLDAATEDTWVIPCHGTVIDLGQDNHTPGCTPALEKETGTTGDPIAHWRELAERLPLQRAAVQRLDDGRLTPVPVLAR